MRFPKLDRTRTLTVRPSNRHARIVTAIARVALGLAIAPVIAQLPAKATENMVLKLDGKGSYVQLPQNLFKDLTQATVEVWAKWDSFNSFSRIFEFGAGWQSMSLFNQATNPILRFNIYSERALNTPSNQHIIRVDGLLRTNDWIHLAAVSGPHGMKLYANGVLVGTNSHPASFAAIKVNQTNLIGRGLTGNATDRDFKGEIDELRVWDHRRNTAQIRDNMFKRLKGREDGLVHLWNFDDGTAADLASNAGKGKLKGNAEIVSGGPAYTVEIPPAPPVITAVPPTMPTNAAAANAAPTVTQPVTAMAPGPVAWWIAGALFALVAVLVWLVLMLRRSGVGSAKLLPNNPQGQLTNASAGALPGEVHAEIKQRALAELTDFAKESLVQGLYSQRAALAEAQKRAEQELIQLEERLVALQLPERIKVYQKRIAELEREANTRGDELHELTNATLTLLREKLAQEQQAAKGSRFN